VLSEFTAAEWIQIAAAGAAGVAALTSIGLAIATFVLASRTGKLAGETTRMAKATEDEAVAVVRQSEATTAQARFSGQALRASIRPWLTFGLAVPRLGVEFRPSEIRINLRVRNVGSGIAFIDPEGCSLQGAATLPGLDQWRKGWAESPVLGTNEETRVRFWIHEEAAVNQDTLASHVDLRILVKYADASLAQPTRVEFPLELKNRRWVVTAAEYFVSAGLPEEEFLTRVEPPS
jgi:hypothetical protein